MLFRVAKYRSFCQCGSSAEHACARCNRPVCNGGLCFVAATGECVDCANGLAVPPRAPASELGIATLVALVILGLIFIMGECLNAASAI